MDRTLVMTALFVSFFPLMSLSDAPTPSPSTVEGVILVSPSRPGPLRKEDSSGAPAGNIEFVVKKGDVKVAAFTTNAEGRFRISLPPGHYSVTREDPGAAIGHWQFEVEVHGGETVKVAWTGFSGMR
jgi:Carboxypeptidase regulatory-like domain